MRGNVLPVSLFFIGFFTLVSITFSLNSCKQTNTKPLFTIGFSQCTGSDLWRRTMLNEMKVELSLHPGVNFIYTDAEDNSQKQISQVHELLEQNIDLLIISPNEAQPLTKIVEQVYSKGIPVIVIDRKTTSPLYTAYVGANNYQIGKMAGQYLSTTLKGPVNILEVMGLPRSSPTIEREKGFYEGIKRFNNVHLTSKVYGDWLKTHAERQLLKIQPELNNINAVFAHNDVMASGTRNIFNQLHNKNSVKIIGVDALPGNGLDLVADKSLYASVLYPTGGKEAIVTAFHILNKEPFLRENILQSLVIDSANVQLMKMQWNKINSQQKDIEKQQVLLKEQQAIYNSQQTVLNIIVTTLVLAIIFCGLAFYYLVENRIINQSLEAKNNEIIDQRNKLIEMSAKAEVATEAKFNFFTNISHEFRTPLTLILSPLEELMQNEKIKLAANNNLTLIYKNVFRLLRLVNELIDYRKLDYEKQHISASPNNLLIFLNDIIENFNPNAQKRNIDLRLISDEQDIRLWFDPNMLDKVIFNLLSNALKFTNNNGRIHVIVKRENNKVFIEVQDNGIGMDQDQMTHIFERFYQARRSTSKGSGLGLSLSKELIGLHHGTIAVASEKWKGTTFTITMQTGELHISAEEKKNEPLNKSELNEKSKLYTTDLVETTLSMDTTVFNIQKEQSVLIIEDNTDLLYFLGNKLSIYFEVFTADNGASGITSAYEQVPDLIISDIMLPKISGNELTEKLKSDVRTSHIPIILLTAKGSMKHQITGIQSMADAYIIKPFNYDYLLATVRNLIKNRFILKEHYISDVTLPNKLPVSKALDKKFINNFSGIVEQNLSNENFSVDDLAKSIGISRVQLYRKVKDLLDCNITDYILSRRLKKAKYLLTHEGYSISEITYMVGFANPNYFSTVFKSKYRCTPSEFKRNQHS